jgi:hypothetical protein
MQNPTVPNGHVRDDLIVLHSSHQAKRARQIVVADDVVGLAKIKVRRDRDKTFSRELICNPAYLIVETEGLHHHHQRWIGAS